MDLGRCVVCKNTRKVKHWNRQTDLKNKLTILLLWIQRIWDGQYLLGILSAQHFQYTVMSIYRLHILRYIAGSPIRRLFMYHRFEEEEVKKWLWSLIWLSKLYKINLISFLTKFCNNKVPRMETLLCKIKISKFQKMYSRWHNLCTYLAFFHVTVLASFLGANMIKS